MASEQLELFDDGEQPLAREAKPPASAEPTPIAKPEVTHPKSGPDAALEAVARLECNRLGLGRLAEKLTVSWNSRMRTAAGRAFLQTGQIELNPKLQKLSDAVREAEIASTFFHELAHLISYARAKGKKIPPHGEEWKQACRDLGIPDEDRCHSLDFEARKIRRKFAYTCPHCSSVIERVRRLKKHVACYDCCRQQNGGRFDSRFALVERKLT